MHDSGIHGEEPSLPAPVGGPRLAWRPAGRGAAAETAAREWIAGLAGRAADEVLIERDARGRPRLAHGPEGGDVGWSHSGDGLLIAFGTSMDVGVDLERIRPRPNAVALARRFFAQAEADWVASRPAGCVETDFLRLWCAKEAVLKAHGEGLAFGLHRLRLAPGPDGALALVECDPRLGLPVRWRLVEWAPRRGYLAALAWRARD
jgi:4'-phosphopantetheinyl transferase